MSGIRVSSLPESSRMEEMKTKLKIHFSKPSNGGGKIKNVYYPVLGKEAVIIFEDPSVVDTVMMKQRDLEDMHPLIVKRLPQKHIFLRVNTELDPDIASILQASEDNMDKIKYDIGIDVHYDDSKTRITGLSGSWYQIEMAWQFIDSLVIEQKQLQRSVQVKMASMQRMQSQKEDEMDIDDNGLKVVDDGRESSLRQASSMTGERTQSEQILLDLHYDAHNWRGMSAETDSDEDEDNRKRSFLAARQRGQSSIHKIRTSNHTMSQSTEQSVEDLRSTELHHIDNNFEREAREMNGRERSWSGQQEKGFESIRGSVREYGRSFHAPMLSDNQVTGLDRDVTQLSPSSTGGFLQQREEGRHRQSHSLDFVSNPGHDDKTSDHFSSLDSQHDLDRYIPKTHVPDRSAQKERDHERDDTGRTTRFGQFMGTDSLLSSRRDYPWQDVYTDATLTHQLQHDEGMSSTVQTSVPKQDTVPVECQDENLKFKFCIGSIHVIVLCGDILKERSCGIVNAANGSLMHAAGVAGAIARAAGPEMELECENFICKHGLLRTTEVMHTSAGGRFSREVTHILHAVGPIWIGETFKDTFHYELTKTFVNCLIYANDKLWLESLTLPLISSGIFGAPLDECVRCFLDGLLVYSKQETKTRHLKKVHLIFKDPDSTMLCIAILQQLLDNGIENLTKEALEMYSVHEIHNSEKARRLDSKAWTRYKYA